MRRTVEDVKEARRIIRAYKKHTISPEREWTNRIALPRIAVNKVWITFLVKEFFDSSEGDEGAGLLVIIERESVHWVPFRNED